eukprot:scaffold453_cov187-Ochromonas_danica.AAC.28
MVYYQIFLLLSIWSIFVLCQDNNDINNSIKLHQLNEKQTAAHSSTTTPYTTNPTISPSYHKNHNHHHHQLQDGFLSCSNETAALIVNRFIASKRDGSSCPAEKWLPLMMKTDPYSDKVIATADPFNKTRSLSMMTHTRVFTFHGAISDHNGNITVANCNFGIETCTIVPASDRKAKTVPALTIDSLTKDFLATHDTYMHHHHSIKLNALKANRQGRLWKITGNCWHEKYEFHEWSNVMCFQRNDIWHKAVQDLVVRRMPDNKILARVELKHNTKSLS